MWWTEEYEPAVRLLRDEDLIADLADDDPGLTETEAYLRFSAQRYRLLRTHDWNERAVEVVREDPPCRCPAVSLTQVSGRSVSRRAAPARRSRRRPRRLV